MNRCVVAPTPDLHPVPFAVFNSTICLLPKMNNVSFALPSQTLVGNTYTVGSEFAGTRRSYYAFAFAVLLLYVAHWSIKPSTRLSYLDAIPRYRVAKWRWLTGAESLLQDSYKKVETCLISVERVLLTSF